MTDQTTTPPESTEPAPAAGEKKQKSWRSDYRFLILASLLLAVLAFNIFEHLLLDTDEADVRYERLVINGSRISDPQPGHVYAFSHHNQKFVESKVCSLQLPSDVVPTETIKLNAANVWGKSVNATIASVGDYVGKKLVSIVTVDNPQGEWVFVKHYRPTMAAGMDVDCLGKVSQMARSGSATPFIVDAVYVDSADETGGKRWVRFSEPLLIDPEACPDCPSPVQIKDVIKTDAFNRFKVEMNIVTVE